MSRTTAAGDRGRGAGLSERALRADPLCRHCTTATAGAQAGQAVRNAAGAVVGRLTPDGWLEKYLDPARHKVRVPAGWATDAAHLDIPSLRGVRLILPGGTTLEAPVEVWRRYGRLMERGHGLQVLLVDAHWQVTRPGEPVAAQLALF